MSDDFNAPGSAEGIKWESLKGRLLLFKVHEVRHGIATAFGESDAVAADVVVLDGDGEEAYIDTLVFPKVLQSQIKSNVGGMVLGRLGQGEPKKNQSPPWKLSDPTDDDKATGRAYLAAQTKAPF
jgi:hypothetical protein